MMTGKRWYIVEWFIFTITATAIIISIANTTSNNFFHYYKNVY